MNEKILVTGGAGYIGSHAARMLIERGFSVVILDNLSKGHKESLPEGVDFYEVDLSDSVELAKIFSRHKIDAVMHFAAFSEVEESVLDPEKYYMNNVSNTINLLRAMKKFNVMNFVFSSTAATFGSPKEMPIKSDSFQNPVNPYGRTKLIIENILDDYDRAYGLKFVCLRYFNAAGAGYGIGEDHRPETHLIPLVLEVALGKRDKIKVFGDDYETEDGTCVRDYIHVVDLSDAHFLALEHLLKGGESGKFNLGSGKGHSVKEIISMAESVCGKEIRNETVGRREGDPAVLVADSSKIRETLGWTPKNGLREIIASAWEWHSKNPDGY